MYKGKHEKKVITLEDCYNLYKLGYITTKKNNNLIIDKE